MKKQTDLLFETPRFKVVKNTFTLPSGKTKEYYCVDKPNAVLVIPVFENKIGLISVKRPTYDWQFSFEFPGGRIENGQTPLEAAKRELLEETNLISENFEYINSVFPLPALTNEKIFAFKAHIDKIENATVQSNEFIEKITFFTIEEIRELLFSGKVLNSIHGYYLAMMLLEKKGLRLRDFDKHQNKLI